jgi:flavorubredoxin
LIVSAFDDRQPQRPYAAAQRFWSNGMLVPVKVVVVYHSGYGHTVKIAEAVARGAAAINGASVDTRQCDRSSVEGTNKA